MKKPFVLIAAIVAAVGLGAAVAAAKETTKVKTSVQLKYHPNDPSDPYGAGGSFSGQVKARKGCEKGRKVVLYDHARMDNIGSDTSNARGKYKIKFIPDDGAPGFHAEAKRKIIKNTGNNIVCKADPSNWFKFD